VFEIDAVPVVLLTFPNVAEPMPPPVNDAVPEVCVTAPSATAPLAEPAMVPPVVM
jgi:hypothetical protein